MVPLENRRCERKTNTDEIKGSGDDGKSTNHQGFASKAREKRHNGVIYVSLFLFSVSAIFFGAHICIRVCTHFHPVAYRSLPIGSIGIAIRCMYVYVPLSFFFSWKIKYSEQSE